MPPVVSLSAHEHEGDAAESETPAAAGVPITYPTTRWPAFYDLHAHRRIEKNWSYVVHGGQLRVIYAWYPMQVCRVDTASNTLISVGSQPMPTFFKDARGSTCGSRRGNEWWFVLHKAQQSVDHRPKILNYLHFFVVLDLNLRLVRRSCAFKLSGDRPVEFCTGIVAETDRLILSYSWLDAEPTVSTYNYAKLETQLRWFDDESVEDRDFPRRPLFRTSVPPSAVPPQE